MELKIGIPNQAKAVYIRIILEEQGHVQPPTPFQTDNAMADKVINGKVQPTQTKTMRMRFHWLRQECQQQSAFTGNLAN